MRNLGNHGRASLPPEPPDEGRIAIEHVGDVTVAVFADRHVLSDQLIQDITALYRLGDADERRKVLLDFGAVEFLPSAALGKLITLHRKLQTTGGRLTLFRIPRAVTEVFQIVRLDRFFTILSHPEQADPEVRAVFGDLLTPAACAPEWRTDTVLALARQARASGEFGTMPILADALQDAGCTNELLLEVCRSDAACVRRRWALEFVLG